MAMPSPYFSMIRCPHCGEAIELRAIRPDPDEPKPRPWSETTGALPNPRQKCISCFYHLGAKCDNMNSPKYEQEVDEFNDGCEHHMFGKRRTDDTG